MNKSVGELIKTPVEKELFDQLLSEKRSLSQKKILFIEVAHFDFFVTI